MPIQSVATLSDAIFVTTFCVPMLLFGLLASRYDRRLRLLPYTRSCAVAWIAICAFGIAFAWFSYALS